MMMVYWKLVQYWYGMNAFAQTIPHTPDIFLFEGYLIILNSSNISRNEEMVYWL